MTKGGMDLCCETQTKRCVHSLPQGMTQPLREWVLSKKKILATPLQSEYSF